jgi:hypothetical protein
MTAPREWLQAAGNIVQHQNVSVIPGSTAFTATVTTQLPPGAGQSLEPMLLDNDRIIIDAGLLDRTDGGPPLLGTTLLSKEPLLLRMQQFLQDLDPRGLPRALITARPASRRSLQPEAD